MDIILRITLIFIVNTINGGIMTTKKPIKTRITSFFLSLSLLIGFTSIITFAQNGGVSHITLLNGARSFFETKLVSLPETYNVSKQLLVFTMDNNAVDKYNYSQISYSVYNGQSFAIPKYIKDDNTWDMHPFIYSNNDVLVAWSDSTKSFNEKSTGYDIASAMRISVAAFEPMSVKSTISNSSFYGSDNISTYNPKATKVDDKILVSWVVCHNIQNDKNAYGIEGLYYNSETNAFYSENNEEDASENPVPMVFAKDCNYISNYSIYEYGHEETGCQIATIFEEAIDKTHISDVMLDKVVTQSYSFYSDKYKDNIIKMATNKGNVVTNLTDGASNASIVDSDVSGLFYYNKNKIYVVNNSAKDGLTPVQVADVSKTGDTKYSFVSKNGDIKYITAIQYEPLKTNENQINLWGKTYTKTDDEKWVDGEGNIQEIKQEDVCFYYTKPETQNFVTLSQKLYNQDRLNFPSSPSFFINDSKQLVCVYTKGEISKVNNSNRNFLVYSVCDEQYILRADYSKVDEAISKANALNKEDYKDFSAVDNAINNVVRDKDITKQDEVNSYAKAINDAISALELKNAPPPVADNPKIVEGANQTVEQGKEATFKSDADFKDFEKVLVDGKEISSNNYILKEGSTVVILKSDYVKTLDVGKHTINIVSTNGSADAEFEVIKISTPDNPNTNSPETGDNSNMILWVILLFISVSGVYALTLKRKKCSK